MALLLIAAFSFFAVAKANPSFFIRGNSLGTPVCSQFIATTSVSYMTAGTATSTVTLDGGCGSAQGADSAALMVQFAGSSTAAVLNADIEYSQDNVDWYATGYAGASDAVSASTSPSITSAQQYIFNFASSTINRSITTNANSATSTRIVRIAMPTRYVRAVFSLPVGSTNGAVWAEFVGKRQGN